MADPAVDGGAPPPETTSPPDDFRPTETVRLEDVPLPEPVETPPSPADDKPAPGSQTPHAKGMAAILEARRAQIERERVAGDVIMGTPEPTPVPTDLVPPAPKAEPEPPRSPPPEPQPTPAVAQAAPPPQPPQPPQPRVHRIVVRGQAIDLSEQDMVRAAQFAVEQEAARREAALQQQQQPPEPQLDRRGLAETVKALQYGDEETATEALAQLSTEIARTLRPPPGPAPQQVDPNWIADQVYQRVNNVQVLENALVRFQNDYPDIVGDEQMTRLAAMEAEQLRNRYQEQGIPRNVEQIMREAADNVRGVITRWRGGASANGNATPTPSTITPAQPVSPAPALAANGNRVAVKRSTPQVPAASSAPQPADTPNVKSGVTGSQVVDWMRRTRNQPVYSR